MRPRQFLIGCYRRLLRLYPPGFRAEYADEMTEVFALAVRESDENDAIWVLLAEVRDLPISVLQAHLRERRLAQLARYEEGLMLHRLESPRVFRWSVRIILTLCLLYTLVVIGAYIAFELHINALEDARLWWYDYDFNPAFITRQIPVGLAVFLLWLMTPPSMVVFGGGLAVNAWRRWYSLSSRQKWLALAGIGAAVLTLVSLATSFGAIGALWFYD